MDKSDPLEPAFNKIIVESIHKDVMGPMAAKGKHDYDISPVNRITTSNPLC